MKPRKVTVIDPTRAERRVVDRPTLEEQIAAMQAMQEEASRQFDLSRDLRTELSKNRFWLGESGYAQIDNVLRDFDHATFSLENAKTAQELRGRRDRLYRVLNDVRAEIWLERQPSDVRTQ